MQYIDSRRYDYDDDQEDSVLFDVSVKHRSWKGLQIVEFDDSEPLTMMNELEIY